MIIYDPKITGSFQINGSTISSVGEIDNLSGSVAALNNASSSYLLNTTDTLTGNLTVTGTLTAQEFHTEYTSASIVYQSGSTKFGDSADDVHSFTGSVKISENVDINGTELTIGNSDTRLAENNLRFKSSGDAYIDHYTTNQSIRIRTSNASALDTEAIIITGGGNFLIGNTVVNPASGFADQTGIGLKYSTTTPSLEVSSDSVALNLNRTTTGGAGVIAEFRSANNVIHSFGSATSYMLGSVGIGTTSPGARLEVVATATTDVDIAHFSNSNSVQKAIIRLSGVGAGELVLRDAGNNEDVVISSHAQTYFNAGNVGIGTTSPIYKLEVSGDSTAGVVAVKNAANGRDTFRSENASGIRTFNVGNDGSGHGITLVRNNSGTTTTYIVGSGNSYFNGGNVGIGTTSPISPLHVEGDTTVTGRLFSSKHNSGTVSGGSWYRIIELTGGSGRGKCSFILESGGGSGTPFLLKGTVNAAWTNSQSTISCDYNSLNSGVQELRVVRNSTSNKTFVDVKFSSGEDSVNVEIMPMGKAAAAAIDFTDVNSLPTGDAVETTINVDGKVYSHASNIVGSTHDQYVLTHDNKLGIGTSSPSNQLHVWNESSAYARLENNADNYLLLGAVGGSNRIYSRNSTDGAYPFAIEIGTSTTLQVDTSGRIGIGTTSMDQKLQTYGSNANIKLVQSAWKNGSGNQGGPKISFHNGGNSGEQGPELATLQSVDAYAVGGAFDGELAVKVSNAGTSTQVARFSKYGVSFGADDPSSANALDDYEEGTFTPTVPGATAYAAQLGKYTKIGNVVYFHLYVQPSAGTYTSSFSIISGLPFTSVNNAILYPKLSTSWSGFGFSGTVLVAQVQPNATTIGAVGCTNNGTFTDVNRTGWSNNDWLTITGFYYTS